MKILTKEEADAHYAVTIRGGLKGAAWGLGTAVPLSLILNRTWPYYRSLPLPLKALGIVTIGVPACVVKAETEGNAWERTLWTDAGKHEIDEIEERERLRWERLSTKEKVLDWAARRRYTIVGASWALSMAVSFGIVMRNPYLTFPQKLVQARMWAQGLTIGVLIASAGLSTKKTHTTVDHSWRETLEEQRKEAEEKAEAAH